MADEWESSEAEVKPDPGGARARSSEWGCSQDRLRELAHANAYDPTRPAAALCITRRELERAVRQAHGVAPRDILRLWRAEHAVLLLLEGRFAKEVVASLGCCPSSRLHREADCFPIYFALTSSVSERLRLTAGTGADATLIAYASSTPGRWHHGASTLDFASADTDYDGCPDAQELAAGTDPFNAERFTPTRLGWWRFNRANWAGEQGQLPLQSYGIQAAASWSGSALKVPGSGTANLKYRDTEATGAANINCRQGTIRFWFSPTWNSGTGPGSWARLIEMGAYTADGGYGFWGLFLNPQGTLLQFHTQGGGTGAALRPHAPGHHAPLAFGRDASRHGHL